MILTRALQTQRTWRYDDMVTRVGGLGAAFVPRVAFTRWEAMWVSLQLLHDAPGVVSVDQQAIVWTAPSLEARFYALGITDGGYECAIHLHQRPMTNELRFAVDTNADVFYQPAFAEVLADDRTRERSPLGGWCSRDAWANDSYAFYAPYSGNYLACGGYNYRAGKVGHLHRAWAVDAVGHRVWCAQRIADGVLTIHVPWDFLASAVYPIMVDPTFGFTTSGGSDDNPGNNYIWSRAFSNPASNGTLDSITVNGRNKAGTTAEFAPSLYSDSTSLPTSRLDKVDSGGATFTGSNANVTKNMPGSFSLVSGTQYWLGQMCDNTNSTTPDYFWRFDTGSSGDLQFKTAPGTPPPMTAWPATASPTGNATEKVTIFGNFTSSGGGGGSTWGPAILSDQWNRIVQG